MNIGMINDEVLFNKHIYALHKCVIVRVSQTELSGSWLGRSIDP